MKRQTLILVVIGVILFVAGSAIAYASVQSATKHSTNGATVAPVTTSAVVAKTNIPVGTTGQAMVSNQMVALELVPAKSFNQNDLTSLQSLSDEVLTAPVKKGQAVSSTVLHGSTSTVSLPQGMDGVTVTINGTAGLAGYLQPGDHVDVYANVTKASTSGAAGAPSSTLPLPCTELAMADIQVLDVSTTSPSLSQTKGNAGRTVPANETLLMAVSSSQARSLEFLSENESVSVVQTQNDTNPPPADECIGTDQTTSAPS